MIKSRWKINNTVLTTSVHVFVYFTRIKVATETFSKAVCEKINCCKLCLSVTQTINIKTKETR